MDSVDSFVTFVGVSPQFLMQTAVMAPSASVTFHREHPHEGVVAMVGQGWRYTNVTKLMFHSKAIVAYKTLETLDVSVRSDG